MKEESRNKNILSSGMNKNVFSALFIPGYEIKSKKNRNIRFRLCRTSGSAVEMCWAENIEVFVQYSAESEVSAGKARINLGSIFVVQI